MNQQVPHNTLHSVARQEKIENCLLENMLSVPYERISVADMCRQMGISRRLYYTYFPDKDACLVSLIDRYVYASIAHHSDEDFAAADYDLTASTIDYLRYWQNHLDFLSMITRQNLKTLMVDRCHICFRDNFHYLLDHLSTPDFQADDSTIWLYAAFCFTILMQWYEQGCQTPVEEMAKKYMRMLKSPLLHDL